MNRNRFPQQTDAVCREYDGPDRLRAGKQEIYLLCRQSIRNSKPAVRIAAVFDPVTVRNRKTVCALYELLTAV